MNTILLAIALTFGPSMTTPSGQRLECGAPRPLANDAVQTVRVCEPARVK